MVVPNSIFTCKTSYLNKIINLYVKVLKNEKIRQNWNGVNCL